MVLNDKRLCNVKYWNDSNLGKRLCIYIRQQHFCLELFGNYSNLGMFFELNTTVCECGASFLLLSLKSSGLSAHGIIDLHRLCFVGGDF